MFNLVAGVCKHVNWAGRKIVQIKKMWNRGSPFVNEKEATL